MRRFLMTVALTCVLSVSAMAGDMPTCGTPAPPPPPSEMQTSPGEIPTDGLTSPSDMPTCGLSAVLAILNLAF